MTNFIRDIIDRDLAAFANGGRVVTRFPPEPNGYLHIGHAKSICLNHGLARDYRGTFHLRFDDTNPLEEDVEYVEAAIRDAAWLGAEWGKNLFYASDYFERMYDWAVTLVKAGKAYVDSQSQEEISAQRGSLTEPGRESPYRNRPVEESLDLLARMRAGEFPDGAHVLRARIDMAAPNMILRDPLLYRIRHASHYRRGDAWCIYPMYDFAHCLEDAIEDITHSICTLEFENNREVYDWLLENLGFEEGRRPKQIEFARLNLGYTVLSKRKLIKMVEGRDVAGWDDPRLPTIAGLRRRGVTPEAIRAFCDMIGVARVNSLVDVEKLEHCIREDLNPRAPRVLCVLRPLRVTIENYPEGKVEALDAPFWPHDVPREGSRRLPFGRELFIDRDDFREDPPKGWHRLAPGREVRLRHAYAVACREVVKDPATGLVAELRCTYDPDTLGAAPAGRPAPKGTIQWVSAAHAVPVTVRLYDRLFTVERPDASPSADFRAFLNPQSLVVHDRALIEPAAVEDPPGERLQFERLGYFYRDPVDSRPGAPVFNRVVTLRDTWAKIEAREEAGGGGPAATGTRKPRQPEAGPGPAAAAAPAPAGRPRSEERDRARERDPALKARHDRYVNELGLSADDADRLTGDPAVADYYDEVRSASENARAAAIFVVNEVLREARGKALGDFKVTGRQVGALLALVDAGTITLAAAKEVFVEMVATGAAPEAIVEEKGLRRLPGPGAFEPVVDRVLASKPADVAAYKAGKTALLEMFMGLVMRETRGKANPKDVRELLQRKLG